MEILNNRELAIVFWLIIFSIYILISKKMMDVRKSFRNVITIFFAKNVIYVLLLMISYVAAIVYILSKVDLWNVAQTKNTIFWCASVGFISLLKLDSIKKDRSFFIHSVIDNLKLLAIFQFIVNVYTFPLWLEIVMVPILVLVGGMSAIADSDRKYDQVKKLINVFLTSFGIIVIVYTLYKLSTDFGKIGQTKTVYDFIIPPLLTLLYIPFIFIMMVYSTYEQISVRFSSFIKNNFLKYLAMIYALVVFNIRLVLLERWSSHVLRTNIQTHRDLVDSFKHILKLQKAEKHPKEVPIEDGWSPYKAKEFLSEDGLQTGFYNMLSNEWFASSNMVQIGDGFLPDYVEYHIEGTEYCAKFLKIILNVNNSNKSTVAHNKLVELSNTLSKASLNRELSDSMKSAMLNGKEYVEEYGNKKLFINKVIWPGHKFNGYDLKFVVSSI